MNNEPTEHQIQSAFADWVSRCGIKGTELGHANPNGGKRPTRSRVNRSGKVVTWSPTATLLKREGVKAGALDYEFPVARGGYIGLAIEFKAKDGNPTKEQRDRIDAMQKEGWLCVLCWSADAAIRVTKGYFGWLELHQVVTYQPTIPVEVGTTISVY